MFVALLVAGCGASEPQRTDAGAIEQAGESRLLELRAGDCVGNLRKSIDEPDGGANGVPAARAVPCAERHDGEIVRISAIADGPWPGAQIVDGEAARGRQALQPRLAAAKSGGAKLTLLTFKPTRERWEFEDQHEIYYLVLYAQQRRGAF